MVLQTGFAVYKVNIFLLMLNLVLIRQLFFQNLCLDTQPLLYMQLGPGGFNDCYLIVMASVLKI